MIRPPSLQHDYDLISAHDEAIAAPPVDASDEDKAAFDAKLAIARDVGDYAGLLVEGKQPTKFTCRPVPQSIMRRIVDRENCEGSERIGTLPIARVYSR